MDLRSASSSPRMHAAALTARCSSIHPRLISGSISSYEGARPGVAEVTNTRCQPRPDSMGPCQDPGLNLTDRRGERASEYRSDLFRRAIAVVILKHEWITDGADNRRHRPPCRRALESARIGVRACLVAPRSGREVHVSERSPTRLGEAFRVPRIPRPQFVGGWITDSARYPRREIPFSAPACA